MNTQLYNQHTTISEKKEKTKRKRNKEVNLVNVENAEI